MNRQLTALVGVASIVTFSAACASGATPASSASAAPVGSAAASAPASPSAAASAPASAAASAPASQAAASLPAASGGAAGAAKLYKCPDLITDAEIQAATGVTDLALVGGPSDNGQEGLSDCGYFGKGGALYVQVTVWTGPMKSGFDQLVAAGKASGAVEPLPGIGDEAGFAVGSEEAANAAARVGDTGVTVAWQQMNTGGLEGIDLKAASQQIMKTVVGRL